jgi:uncharacterized protein
MRVVIDTNILLVSISSRSKFHPIYRAVLDGLLELCVSNSILQEYEEILGLHWNPVVAANTIDSLLRSPYVQLIDPRFKWSLIHADPNDDKFVDCAVAANALYLATNDTDFNVLKTSGFPPLNIIDAQMLLQILQSKSAQ